MDIYTPTYILYNYTDASFDRDEDKQYLSWRKWRTLPLLTSGGSTTLFQNQQTIPTVVNHDPSSFNGVFLKRNTDLNELTWHLSMFSYHGRQDNGNNKIRTCSATPLGIPAELQLKHSPTAYFHLSDRIMSEGQPNIRICTHGYYKPRLKKNFLDSRDIFFPSQKTLHFVQWIPLETI